MVNQNCDGTTVMMTMILMVVVMVLSTAMTMKVISTLRMIGMEIARGDDGDGEGRKMVMMTSSLS